jgi:hypothetical protein
METMRRLLASVLGLSLLCAVWGCNHTAGVCDCDQGHTGAINGPLVPTPVVQPH